MLKAAIVTTLGEWGSGDPLEHSWIAHGPAMLATIGGDLFETRRHTKGSLKKALQGYELIGVSANSAGYQTAREVLQLIRDIPAQIAVGGMHATLSPSDYDEFQVDYIVQGHGETPWKKLIDGEELPKLSRWETDDLDSLPFIDRSKWGPEVNWLGLPGPYATFIAARGCPYRCSFCWPSEQTHFGRIRRRTPENLVEEIQDVQTKYGIRSAQVHDDTFTYQYDWTERFIELAGALGLQYFIGTRADHIVRWPEQFKRLKTAGVQVVSVGFESGSDRILELMRKQTTVEENIAAADILHTIGFTVFANTMFGMPSETREDMEATLTMLRRISPVRVSASVFSPYPGNELGDKLRAEGVIKSRIWRRDPSRVYLPDQNQSLLDEMVNQAYRISQNC